MIAETKHDEREALQHALAALQGSTGLPVAFGGLVEGGLLPLEAFRGTRTTALHGVVVKAGAGLGGKVIGQARPRVASDYLSDRSISHHYDPVVAREGLRSLAAVPVVVSGSVAAVLYAGLHQTAPIGERALRCAMDVARTFGGELAVRREVAARVANAEARLAARGALHHDALEDVRAAYAELRALLVDTADEATRERLRAIVGLLAAAAGPRDAATTVKLTAREVDVLAHVATGCRNAEVGDRLGLLPETVKAYLRSAYRKLGAGGRHEAVVRARREGLLP